MRHDVWQITTAKPLKYKLKLLLLHRFQLSWSLLAIGFSCFLYRKANAEVCTVTYKSHRTFTYLLQLFAEGGRPTF